MRKLEVVVAILQAMLLRVCASAFFSSSLNFFFAVTPTITTQKMSFFFFAQLFAVAFVWNNYELRNEIVFAERVRRTFPFFLSVHFLYVNKLQVFVVYII